MDRQFLPSNVQRSLAVFAVVMVFIFAGAAFAAGPVIKTLYKFHGSDGAYPSSAVLLDPAGNVIGTTPSGGLDAGGVVFQLTPTKSGLWTESLLANNVGAGGGGANGPNGGLVSDPAGNLYGTTLGGGPYVGGNVFELSPPQVQGGQWTLTVLYNFQWGTDGARPYGGVVRDQAGNLYGATSLGGGTKQCLDGCGIIFQLVPPAQPGGAWTENILHRFQSGKDAATPIAGLTMDSHGNLYGTTINGGAFGGTVFELTPPVTKHRAWHEKVLHSFTGADGAAPYGGVIVDPAGNLYGTTTFGGTNNGCGIGGGLTTGTVFQLQPPARQGDPWTENVLLNFPSGAGQGCAPYAGVIMDAKGNLYGTAELGGNFSRACNYGCGVVYELTPPQPGGAWTEVVLHYFTNGSDGTDPVGDLIFDKEGRLYGTTYGGANPGVGTVFRLVP